MDAQAIFIGSRVLDPTAYMCYCKSPGPPGPRAPRQGTSIIALYIAGCTLTWKQKQVVGTCGGQAQKWQAPYLFCHIHLPFCYHLASHTHHQPSKPPLGVFAAAYETALSLSWVTRPTQQPAIAATIVRGKRELQLPESRRENNISTATMDHSGKCPLMGPFSATYAMQALDSNTSLSRVPTRS